MKSLLLFFLFSTTTIPLYSQSVTSVFSLQEAGIVAGPGTTVFSHSDIFSEGRYFRGLQHAGLNFNFRYKQSERLSLNARLLYESITNNYEESFTLWDPEKANLYTCLYVSTIDLRYFSLPVSMRYHIGQKKNFSVSLGMFGSLFHKGKVVENYVYPWETKNYSTATVNGMKKYNVGITGGIGYRLLHYKNVSASLELNARWGLMDVRNGIQHRMWANSFRTNAFALSLILGWIKPVAD